MPNAKIYIDERTLAGSGLGVDPALAAIRDVLCQAFGVAEQACHIAVIAVKGLAGQTPVNIELAVLHKEGRSPEAVDAACAKVQDRAAAVFGVPAAIRCTLMAPESYVVRR